MTLRPLHHRGFTLAEVMISVAMMLIILLGINRIFKMTGDTVGAGLAVSESLRTTRGLRDMLHNDFLGRDEPYSGIVPAADAPFIAIRCQSAFAFLNRADRLSDADQQPQTVDLNGNGSEGDSGESLNHASAVYNHRHHRHDTLSFFSRGFFPRQTGHGLGGSNNLFHIDMSSTEAWIWYGHLMLPYNPALPPEPANQTQYNISGFLPPRYETGVRQEPDNPFNFYAASWILGRSATLLLPPEILRAISRKTATPITDYTRVTFLTKPLSAASSSLKLPIQINASLTSYDNGNLTNSGLPNDLIEHGFYDVAEGTIAGYQQIARNGGAASNWFSPLVRYNNQAHQAYRFNCNPFFQKPSLSDADASRKLARGMAQSVPALAHGCTKFIVDFAGDYYTQPASGSATVGPDGTIDYDWYNNARHIRWYGLKRLTEGRPDVVLPPRTTDFPFVHESDATNGRLVCVWGPNELNPPLVTSALPASNPQARSYKPWLIRITVQVADPRGRLGEGLPQEFVYKVR